MSGIDRRNLRSAIGKFLNKPSDATDRWTQPKDKLSEFTSVGSVQEAVKTDQNERIAKNALTQKQAPLAPGNFIAARHSTSVRAAADAQRLSRAG